MAAIRWSQLFRLLMCLFAAVAHVREVRAQLSMSALGQKQTLQQVGGLFALPPIAHIR